MRDILNEISLCIQRGKIDQATQYPPDMNGLPGADELTGEALSSGVSAHDILNSAMIPAMGIVGELFRNKKLFVPQVLMSAKAMNKAMVHLKPFFASGLLKQKGVFVIGTVSGDLHDIGKNLVSMIIEGAGWRVIDLGVDVSSEKFVDASREHPDSIIGMSALLTTTMESMEKAVAEVKKNNPGQRVIVGGAPLSNDFAMRIGADLFAPNPQSAVAYLNTLSDGY